MKTAGREKPNRWAANLSNRANGAAGQNRSCSIKWAAKEEKFQPREKFFFFDGSSAGSCREAKQKSIWLKESITFL